MKKLLFAGFGVIGRGLAESLLAKDGKRFKVVGIIEKDYSIINEDGIDLKRALSKGLAGLPGKVTKKPDLIIRSLDYDILCEMTPGNIRDGGVGLSYMKAALRSGRDVVTSNKSPLVVAFDELMQLARDNDAMMRYEATVCGAIPVISTCLNQLGHNRITNIKGIFNGTTNYILSKMSEESVDFQVALKEAQELGYAETDPSYDVDGVDAGAKVCILANTILGKSIGYGDVDVQGIGDITLDSIDLAKKHGYVIKLIGDVAAQKVAPTLVPEDHPLNVAGTLNAVQISCDLAGAITMIGAGAGSRETSSALIADLMGSLGPVHDRG
ncbi:homoserine dehydrogenase [Candidatus Altiarchaeota archaeon]